MAERNPQSSADKIRSQATEAQVQRKSQLRAVKWIDTKLNLFRVFKRDETGKITGFKPEFVGDVHIKVHFEDIDPRNILPRIKGLWNEGVRERDMARNLIQREQAANVLGQTNEGREVIVQSANAILPLVNEDGVYTTKDMNALQDAAKKAYQSMDQQVRQTLEASVANALGFPAEPSKNPLQNRWRQGQVEKAILSVIVATARRSQDLGEGQQVTTENVSDLLTGMGRVLGFQYANRGVYAIESLREVQSIQDREKQRKELAKGFMGRGGMFTREGRELARLNRERKSGKFVVLANAADRLQHSSTNQEAKQTFVQFVNDVKDQISSVQDAAQGVQLVTTLLNSNEQLAESLKQQGLVTGEQNNYEVTQDAANTILRLAQTAQQEELTNENITQRLNQIAILHQVDMGRKNVANFMDKTLAKWESEGHYGRAAVAQWIGSKFRFGVIGGSSAFSAGVGFVVGPWVGPALAAVTRFVPRFGLNYGNARLEQVRQYAQKARLSVNPISNDYENQVKQKLQQVGTVAERQAFGAATLQTSIGAATAAGVAALEHWGGEQIMRTEVGREIVLPIQNGFFRLEHEILQRLPINQKPIEPTSHMSVDQHIDLANKHISYTANHPDLTQIGSMSQLQAGYITGAAEYLTNQLRLHPGDATIQHGLDGATALQTALDTHQIAVKADLNPIELQNMSASHTPDVLNVGGTGGRFADGVNMSMVADRLHGLDIQNSQHFSEILRGTNTQEVHTTGLHLQNTTINTGASTPMNGADFLKQESFDSKGLPITVDATARDGGQFAYGMTDRWDNTSFTFEQMQDGQGHIDSLMLTTNDNRLVEVDFPKDSNTLVFAEDGPASHVMLTVRFPNQDPVQISSHDAFELFINKANIHGAGEGSDLTPGDHGILRGDVIFGNKQIDAKGHLTGYTQWGQVRGNGGFEDLNQKTFQVNSGAGQTTGGTGAGGNVNPFTQQQVQGGIFITHNQSDISVDPKLVDIPGSAGNHGYAIDQMNPITGEKTPVGYLQQDTSNPDLWHVLKADGSSTGKDITLEDGVLRTDTTTVLNQYTVDTNILKTSDDIPQGSGDQAISAELNTAGALTKISINATSDFVKNHPLSGGATPTQEYGVLVDYGNGKQELFVLDQNNTWEIVNGTSVTPIDQQTALDLMQGHSLSAGVVDLDSQNPGHIAGFTIYTDMQDGKELGLPLDTITIPGKSIGEALQALNLTQHDWSITNLDNGSGIAVDGTNIHIATQLSEIPNSSNHQMAYLITQHNPITGKDDQEGYLQIDPDPTKANILHVLDANGKDTGKVLTLDAAHSKLTIDTNTLLTKYAYDTSKVTVSTKDDLTSGDTAIDTRTSAIDPANTAAGQKLDAVDITNFMNANKVNTNQQYAIDVDYGNNKHEIFVFDTTSHKWSIVNGDTITQIDQTTALGMMQGHSLSAGVVDIDPTNAGHVTGFTIYTDTETTTGTLVQTVTIPGAEFTKDAMDALKIGSHDWQTTTLSTGQAIVVDGKDISIAPTLDATYHGYAILHHDYVTGKDTISGYLQPDTKDSLIVHILDNKGVDTGKTLQLTSGVSTTGDTSILTIEAAKLYDAYHYDTTKVAVSYDTDSIRNTSGEDAISTRVSINLTDPTNAGRLTNIALDTKFQSDHPLGTNQFYSIDVDLGNGQHELFALVNGKWEIVNGNTLTPLDQATVLGMMQHHPMAAGILTADNNTADAHAISFVEYTSQQPAESSGSAVLQNVIVPAATLDDTVRTILNIPTAHGPLVTSLNSTNGTPFSIQFSGNATADHIDPTTGVITSATNTPLGTIDLQHSTGDDLYFTDASHIVHHIHETGANGQFTLDDKELAEPTGFDNTAIEVASGSHLVYDYGTSQFFLTDDVTKLTGADVFGKNFHIDTNAHQITYTIVDAKGQSVGDATVTADPVPGSGVLSDTYHIDPATNHLSSVFAYDASGVQQATLVLGGTHGVYAIYDRATNTITLHDDTNHTVVISNVHTETDKTGAHVLYDTKNSKGEVVHRQFNVDSNKSVDLSRSDLQQLQKDIAGTKTTTEIAHDNAVRQQASDDARRNLIIGGAALATGAGATVGGAIVDRKSATGSQPARIVSTAGSAVTGGVLGTFLIPVPILGTLLGAGLGGGAGALFNFPNLREDIANSGFVRFITRRQTNEQENPEDDEEDDQNQPI